MNKKYIVIVIIVIITAIVLLSLKSNVDPAKQEELDKLCSSHGSEDCPEGCFVKGHPCMDHLDCFSKNTYDSEYKYCKENGLI